MTPLQHSRWRIGVLCGSREGRESHYVRVAHALGIEIAQLGVGLVYGAGGRGIMGAVSRAAHLAGASVTGVIPQALHEREKGDDACGEIFIVRSMHERKALMYKLSDAFIVLPGGLGTLDELVEVATWNQLGYHSKPIALVNVRGFFEPLIAMLDRMVESGFLGEEERAVVRAVADTQAALDLLDVLCAPKLQPLDVHANGVPS